MKKKNKAANVPLREAFGLNVRTFNVWWRLYPAMLLSAAAYTIVSAFLPYVGLYFSAKIIDELAQARRPEVLLQLVLAALLITAAMSFGKAALERWKNYERAGWFSKDDKLYSDKLLSLDFCALDAPRTHELLSQVRQNAQWFGWGIGMPVGQLETLLTAVLQIGGSIALTVSLFTLSVPSGPLTVLNNPLSAALSAVVLLTVALLVPALSNAGSIYWVSYADKAKEGNRKFGFYGFAACDRRRALDTRVYRQDILCQKSFLDHNLFGVKSDIAKLARGPIGLYSAASSAISYAFTGLVYVFVCLKAWGGAFGIGAVTQYVGAITLLSGGVASLFYTLGEMRVNAAFLRTTYEFLDIPNTMYQGSLTVEKRADRCYNIEFRDVSFKYPGAETWALRHVSMTFKVGERLAVVGRNGSGKTTFIKLLCRLYDPTEGEILLNGIDIRKYNYAEYLSVFSVIFQDFKLFAFPLGQNVTASAEPDRTRVETCLTKAGFSDRLKEMPQGIDTCLYKDFDEKGVEISGGEAQKIAIARALYKDAPFIVMDEPTAALDPVAEYEVYSKFNEIIGDKTAIFISHRLSSCRFCDEIAVFDLGSVVQKGSHDALLKEENGIYSKLWYAQAQYYLETGQKVPSV
jgi:ATP-binding cassette subfamily B protein